MNGKEKFLPNGYEYYWDDSIPGCLIRKMRSIENKSNEKQAYIINKDGLIQKITDICMCDQCKERGELEFRIENLNGEFIDYIKYHELYDYVKNISFDLSELSCENNLYEAISKMLHDKLVEIL